MSQRSHGSTCLCATRDKRQRYCLLIKAVLAVLYTVASTFQPLPQDIYRYDLKDPFSLQKGWLLWAEIGLTGAIAAIAVTGAAASLFKGESLEREEDALVSLFPLIGSSSVRHFTSTACLLGVTGVLAPILEETKFKLVCWKVEAGLTSNLPPRVPTPVAIGISAVVFALAHLTPEEFPSCSAVGLSYAQTHNLLTPITIDALWNSGVILLLTFLHINMMMSEY
ncbi:unnamed protein product [Prunus armeniaca]|uniref:CAAX prenyl protease 2/Lysostaphin resistance protein A-like domain-containing protein n=1 Tax=Prunus armeniaca TaxID=36596 RepID=A0A6J5TL83_PRUAR|nr:unnamed protein product [Prunus armeniaca]